MFQVCKGEASIKETSQCSIYFHSLYQPHWNVADTLSQVWLKLQLMLCSQTSNGQTGFTHSLWTLIACKNEFGRRLGRTSFCHTRICPNPCFTPPSIESADPRLTSRASPSSSVCCRRTCIQHGQHSGWCSPTSPVQRQWRCSKHIRQLRCSWQPDACQRHSCGGCSWQQHRQHKSSR